MLDKKELVNIHRFKIDTKLIVFITYNIAYLMYSAGIISQSINLCILCLFLIQCMITYFRNTDMKLKKSSIGFNDIKNIFLMYFLLFIISVVVQLINSDFRLYLFSDLSYLVIPPILAFFWINTVEKNKQKQYLYIMFARLVIQFLVANLTNMNLEVIKAISWNDTKSSVFESSIAHDFLLLEIIFLYFNDKKCAFLSMILCLLSFKRTSFILSILFFIIYCFKNNLIYISYISKNKRKKISNKLPRWFNVCIILIFCIAPYFMKWCAIDGGTKVVFDMTGIDIEHEATGRFELIRYTYQNIQYFNGLGSIINFFENSIYSRLGNMHCDVLRLYWETTIIGVIAFAFTMTKFSSKHKILSLIWIYIVIELITSHFLHLFSFMITFYMFAAIVTSDIKFKNKELIVENRKE